MIQFCYSRLYLGLEIVSCRLLLKMARMYMDLKLNNVAQLFQVLMLYACSGGGTPHMKGWGCSSSRLGV